jgi:hypothetical protein
MIPLGHRLSWVGQSPPRLADDGRIVVTLYVRRWHPGYWLAALRAVLS